MNMIISWEELLVYFIFKRHDGSSFLQTYIGDFGLRKSSVPNIKNASDLLGAASRESCTSRHPPENETASVYFWFLLD